MEQLKLSSLAPHLQRYFGNLFVLTETVVMVTQKFQITLKDNKAKSPKPLRGRDQLTFKTNGL